MDKKGKREKRKQSNAQVLSTQGVLQEWRLKEIQKEIKKKEELKKIYEKNTEIGELNQLLPELFFAILPPTPPPPIPTKTPRKRSKNTVPATPMTITRPMLGDATPGPAPTPPPIRVPPKLKAPRVAEKPPPAKKAKPTAKAKGKSLKDTEKENHEHIEEENYRHTEEENHEKYQKKKKLIVTLRIKNALTWCVAKGATGGPAGAPSEQLQQGLNGSEPGPQGRGFRLKKPSRKA